MQVSIEIVESFVSRQVILGIQPERARIRFSQFHGLIKDTLEHDTPHPRRSLCRMSHIWLGQSFLSGQG